MSIRQVLKAWMPSGFVSPFRPARTLTLGSILLGALGAPIVSPQRTNDLFIKAANSALPNTEDDSTIHATPDDSLDIFINENKSASVYLDLQQTTDQYLLRFPDNLLRLFPDSPGALELKREFLKAYSGYEYELEQARHTLEQLNLTPETVKYSLAGLGSNLQAQRKDAFLSYGEAVNKAENGCGHIAQKAYQSARLALADSLYETLKFWEESFDVLFKPVSDSNADKKAFEEAKSTFLNWMKVAHQAHEQLVSYGITPEQFLDGSYQENKREITSEEIQKLLASQNINVSVEEVKQKFEKTGEGKMPAMIQEIDPRDIAYAQYTSTVIDIYDAIVRTTSEGLKRSEEIADKNQELRKNGAKLFTTKEDDDEALEAYRQYLKIFETFRATFANRPEIIKPSKADYSLYNKVAYARYDTLLKRRADTWYRFIASINQDEARLNFCGRWWENHYNSSKEDEQRQLYGIYLLADTIRAKLTGQK